MRRCSVVLATLSAFACGARSELGFVAVGDGGHDAARTCPTATWNAFWDEQNWAAFDTSAVVNDIAFSGAAFDGRYVYLIPGAPPGSQPRTGLGRFDTHGAFTDPASWSSFDVSTVSQNAGNGVGHAAFDGRYLYFTAAGGEMLRYDTMATFSSTSSWATHAVITIMGPWPFDGAIFDGRYVYFVPALTFLPYSFVARYDTTAAFDAESSWTLFDLTTVNEAVRAFAGGTFDGRYVYLVPFENGNANQAAWDGIAARYDTTLDFNTPGSWATFDVAMVNQGAKGFAAGFFGTAFDGRYVYFVPNVRAGNVTRFDTTGGFATGGSWEAFDYAAMNGGDQDFAGAVFDGEYVYFAGAGSAVVERFDARSPPCLPSAWQASFF